MRWKRRDWLAGVSGVAAAALGTGCSRPASKEAESRPAGAQPGLPLEQYEPKSMLHAAESKVPRARFPVIDIHTHLTFVNPKDQKVKHNGSVEEILAVMDRKNIRTLVDLTGGCGDGLKETVAHWQTPHPDRFLVFTEPWWSRASEPNYAQFQAEEIQKAHQAGAKGIKVLKTLGLYLRDGGPEGKLVKVDDPRFDPMWEAAAALNMPVAIHTSDPEAFFLPIDRYNERYEELHAHPDWSFYGKDFPSNRELQEARARVIGRHPKTQFIALHVADAEDLRYVSELMDKYPNMSVEIGARIGELGRQPRAARKFFDKYQDRILFGTDAVPHGDAYPQQVYGDLLYEIYYRFLETEDEYFDYAPARIPPQGRWRIYGLGLAEGILKKVYHGNAARLLGIKV
ncbi:MAG TPA: amidohydrolase family protein [Bryobacteraceae bacterium]|nr:amidohydrolase family protein [Bryobacteraceae bacterium]